MAWVSRDLPGIGTKRIMPEAIGRQS